MLFRLKSLVFSVFAGVRVVRVGGVGREINWYLALPNNKDTIDKIQDTIKGKRDVSKVSSFGCILYLVSCISYLVS